MSDLKRNPHPSSGLAHAWDCRFDPCVCRDYEYRVVSVYGGRVFGSVTRSERRARETAQEMSERHFGHAPYRIQRRTRTAWGEYDV